MFFISFSVLHIFSSHSRHSGYSTIRCSIGQNLDIYYYLTKKSSEQDSNLRICGSEPHALPLGYSPSKCNNGGLWICTTRHSRLCCVPYSARRWLGATQYTELVSESPCERRIFAVPVSYAPTMPLITLLLTHSSSRSQTGDFAVKGQRHDLFTPKPMLLS